MGAYLVIQLLRLCASNTGDAGLITCQGTKFPHAALAGGFGSLHTPGP